MNATTVTSAEAGAGVRQDRRASARPGPDVSRAITWAAYAVPLCALPSGLWRIALVVGWPDWYAGHVWLPGERPYVLSLSLIAECLALLTLGLVRPWGERLPAWLPFAGGRVVPVRAAVVPASIGAFLATALGAYATLNYFFHFVPPLNDNGEAFPTSGPGAWALWACYVPILAWGPLLAVVTRAYSVRRNRTQGTKPQLPGRSAAAPSSHCLRASRGSTRAARRDG